jgi:Cu/Ag efflux pump CusA
VQDIRTMLVDRPGGGHVRLGQVADVRVAPTPSVIRREAVSRRLDITADVAGRDLGAVADDVRDRVAQMTFPLEYHAQVVEETTAEEIGLTAMIATALVALVAAFLLLQAATRSWRLAIAGFLVLPAALVGGVVAALAAGADLTLGSLLGFLALFGLATRQGLTLVRHLQHVERGDREADRAALVERGAGDRLAPVVTSTAVLAVIALPFVVAGPDPGLEVVQPMAVVLLGGLVSAALATLFVLPAAYLRSGAAPDRSAEDEDAILEEWAAGEPLGAAPEPVAAGAGRGRNGGRNGGHNGGNGR